MAYRNGTYVAFHANKLKEPTASDIKYFNLLKAWNVRPSTDFSFVDSHEKAGAVRDSSRRATLERSLKTRMLSSKNMILIIGETTKEDTDWVPFEIRYAVDECKIPIVAAYPGYPYIMAPEQLSEFWPQALAIRIRSETAHVIHVPFKQQPIADAAQRFSWSNYPKGGGLGYYNRDAYQQWGLL